MSESDLESSVESHRAMAEQVSRALGECSVGVYRWFYVTFACRALGGISGVVIYNYKDTLKINNYFLSINIIFSASSYTKDLKMKISLQVTTTTILISKPVELHVQIFLNILHIGTVHVCLCLQVVYLYLTC